MKNLNVLIIEDETIIALALMEKVKKLGTNVIDYVASFEEAYDALEQHPNINLLLVDINLNNSLNGIDLVDSLSKPLEVIYITAYDDTQNIQKAIKTNPLGYLLKPVNEKELYALLQLCREKYKRNNESMKEIKLPQGYVFNPKEDELSYQGQEIKLRGKQLELFKLLIQ
ncbi:MAG TPA: response regulator, partial [Campylobacterales bacterium]|nr:response regulator [Campylobacterales bacterium]